MPRLSVAPTHLSSGFRTSASDSSPLLIGKILDKTNPDIVEKLANGTLTPEQASQMYDYTYPLLMLAFLGLAALLLGFVLKLVDARKHIGLEEPNIKP